MIPLIRYHDNKAGPWILALAKVLFGTMAISLKLVPAPVVILVLAMHFFGAVGSLPKAWGDLKLLSWKTIAKISALGLAVVTTDVTYFFAVRLMDVSVATLVRWVAPIMLAAGLFMFTQHKSSKTIIATAAAFIGLFFLLNGKGIAFGTANIAGISLALLSAVSVAIYWYSSKQLLRYSTPMVVLFLRSVVACLALLLFVSDWSAAISWWPQVLLFGIVYGLVAAYLDTLGIQGTAAQRVGIIGYILPLTTLLGAAVVLGETFTPLMALGGVIILASGLWAQRR